MITAFKVVGIIIVSMAALFGLYVLYIWWSIDRELRKK